MKHFKGGEGNLTTLLGLQETTLDDHRKSVFPLVNPHCPVPWHCCHFPAETELPLHGLPVLLSKVECSHTAHEVREGYGITTQRPIWIYDGISDGTNSTSSVPHQLVYMYARYKTRVVLTMHKIKILHNSSTSLQVYCAHAAGVSREVKMHRTSCKQCRPTLSMCFTSKPQDLTRYSTMDSWFFWAAQCKAVYPSSSESKRWSFILRARYSATARWPPTAHAWKALRPPYIEQDEQAENRHHQCTQACRRARK